VLEDIREGDVGAILGWGFAPWSGGPFSWLDMIGAAKAAQVSGDLATRHGARFATPPSLTDMAEAAGSFYDKTAASAKAA
ncbi:MAG: 3-hydroxyacyl-CoA dehydrogenase, partial [Pseudomonadota bacterium]